MTKRQKALDRLISEPCDFSWAELRRVLGGLGYIENNKGSTSGSRVAFVGPDDALILLHKPHPGNIMCKAAVKQVKEHLKDKGLI